MDSKLVKLFRYFIPFQIYQNIRGWAYHTFLNKDISYRKVKEILNAPRRKTIDLSFRGTDITIIDGESFWFMYNEIFQKEIYKFNTQKKEPLIIDCGANIGLSIIYLKFLYPNARIVAFEPDPFVFGVLEKNIESHGFQNIQLYNNAVSDVNGKVSFLSEGSDAGRIESQSSDGKYKTVETTKLSNYIHKEVDLLKIDIEGAETSVIKEIKDKLHLVNNIFVEYHSFIDLEFTLHDILKILNKTGFKLYINTPGISSDNPFLWRPNKYGMDMQLNIYGFKNELDASE